MQPKDALGWRFKFGVLAPLTNTIVQPDFDAMRPMGVTNHLSRIFTENNPALSNEDFMHGTELIALGVDDAVRSVMTCAPDYLVMGMSAITFYGGVAGAEAFQKKVTDLSKVGVSTGSQSCVAALQAYGNIKRIAFVSPYYPRANDEVRRFFQNSASKRCAISVFSAAPGTTSPRYTQADQADGADGTFALENLDEHFIAYARAQDSAASTDDTRPSGGIWIR